MAQETLKNIAIVGVSESNPLTTKSNSADNRAQASGNMGSSILSHLLETNKFNITVIQRSESTAIFPPSSSIRVEKGDLSDQSFLQSGFKNQDAAIFSLDFRAMDVQKTLIEAAAKAGVRWILPTEYAGDGMNKHMVNNVPIFWPKREALKHIEELAKTHEGLKWIGVATNPWLELVGHPSHEDCFGSRS